MLLWVYRLNASLFLLLQKTIIQIKLHVMEAFAGLNAMVGIPKYVCLNVSHNYFLKEKLYEPV